MRTLGVDFGTKRIGLAVSDDAGVIAYPKKVLDVSKMDGAMIAQALHDFAVQEEVRVMVVGDSRDNNMQENEIMKTVHPIAKEVAREIGVPLHFEIESYTTQGAVMLDKHMQHKTKNRKAGGVYVTNTESHDAQAAALMLQRFLERQDCDKNN